ncbi:family 16 glycoside hydrolase [Candidatus Poribacteria bacterium]
MKRIIVVLTLLVITTSAYAGTHVFNFDDAGQLSGNWFIRDGKIWPQDPENVDWSVENGELVAISSDVCAGLSGNWILDDTYMDWKNYETSCRFKLVNTLVPNCKIYSNVIFSVHINLPTGIFLSLETRGAGGPWDKVVLGTSEFRWVGQPSLRTSLEEGRWYTVRMVAEDGNYQIFIDDELIVETRNTNLNSARGLAGFGIKNAEMHFDDFTITGEDIPETLSPASQDLITRMGLKPMIPESEMQQSEKLAAVSARAKLATTWGQVKAR